MKILGFNFKKISVEKTSDTYENIKVDTHIDISKIEKIDLDFFKGKEEVLSIHFTYKIDYSPSIAQIELKGIILLAVDQKKAKEVLDEWKNKKIPEEIKFPLFNTIIKKSSIKSLQLEDEMNLPLHFPFPSLKKNEEEIN